MQQVHLVPLENVDAVWPHVLPLLKDALEHCSDLSISQLMTGCRGGYYYLFVKPDASAAAVCGFIKNRDGEEFKMLAMGATGSFVDTLEYIKSFALENGAKRLTFEGRKGWARKLKLTPKAYKYEVSL